MQKKYQVLLASLVIQTCLGGIYAWSTFVVPLTTTYGLSPAGAQLIFGVTIMVFTLAMIFAGRLQSRIGPRPVAAIGGVLFAGGYFYAASTGGHLMHLLFGLSILSGIGIGMGYVCPLATCVKWFPKHKGLVTGVSVASFGSGAILLSSIADHFLGRGVDVLTVFRGIAYLYGILIVAAAMFLDVPEQTAGAVPYKCYAGIWRTRPFRLLCTGMFCGTFSGLLVIGNLKPIGLNFGIEPLYATIAISAFAIGNGIGRVLWGWVLDRAGKIVIPLSLGVLAAAVIALFGVSGMNAGFVAAAFGVGFAFGACFVLYAAHLATAYGSEAVGSVYPLVFLAYGISGVVGPTVGGLLFEISGSYLPSILLAAAVATAGALLLGLFGLEHQRAGQAFKVKDLKENDPEAAHREEVPVLSDPEAKCKAERSAVRISELRRPGRSRPGARR
jgi:MFS transporter, OFA family, oxalate/formate antiporter